VCNEGVLKIGEVCYCWVARVSLCYGFLRRRTQYFGAVRLRHSEESQAGQGVGAWHLATTTRSIVLDRWRLLFGGCRLGIEREAIDGVCSVF
jgi:hypothetical protein